MKIINPEVGIFSDPHYGIHRNSEVWHQIAIDHAKWAANEFKQRSIKDIIIPGDIFHDRNDIAVNTLYNTTAVLDVFKDFNIIITVGNHDAFYRDRSDINSISILKGWSNITVVDTFVLTEHHGKKIAFCPWGQNVNDIPECDIIFGHFEINSFKMNSHKVCTDGVKPIEFTSKASLTISGHFHHREVRKFKDSTILYVGCPYQQDWGDYETTKGLYILDLDTLKYDFIENTISPKYNKIRFSDIERGAYKPDNLTETIKGNIVKFYIDRKLEPEAVDIIVRKLVSYKPTEFTIEYDYVELSKIDDKEANNRDFNISVEKSIDEFIDLIEIKHKDKVKTYVSELLAKAQS